YLPTHCSILFPLYSDPSSSHVRLSPAIPLLFFLYVTATTEIYTLSLHDALPISPAGFWRRSASIRSKNSTSPNNGPDRFQETSRSEEHTSELQSHLNLVCRLLLEKKKKKKQNHINIKIE